jgi:hypothetical protein
MFRRAKPESIEFVGTSLRSFVLVAQRVTLPCVHRVSFATRLPWRRNLCLVQQIGAEFGEAIEGLGHAFAAVRRDGVFAGLHIQSMPELKSLLSRIDDKLFVKERRFRLCFRLPDTCTAKLDGRVSFCTSDSEHCLGCSRLG